MTTDVVRPKPPSPGWGVWCAVALECAIVLTFFINHSFAGLCLCALYSWFTATWAMLSDRLRDD